MSHMQLRQLTVPISPAGRVLLARGIAAVGYGFLLYVLLDTGLAIDGGHGGLDATYYWVAAQRLVNGTPIYAVEYGSFLAYSYPPILAQALTPFLLIPAGAFVWLWRALELACLAYAVGGWTRAGIAVLVFPPVIAEIETGNVHLIMAAVCVMAMRGRSGLVVPSGLLKFASAPLLPLAWVGDRRGLLIGGLAAIAVAAASMLTAWGYWQEYATFLTTSVFPTGDYNVAAFLPVPIRLAIAAALGLAAVWLPRLAPIAVVLAYPVVWFHGLSTLLAALAPLAASRRHVDETGPRPTAARDDLANPASLASA